MNITTAMTGRLRPVRAETAALEAAVASGETTPALAAERLLRAFGVAD